MIAMTSTTHPIRVDFLPRHLLGAPGRIGMTFAPGKKDRGQSGLWDRDLDADLARLVDVYEARVLVSLMEDGELADVGLADLASRVTGRLALRRFPFRDAGIPASMAQAEEIVSCVLDGVRGGLTVVVHCRGGLGRTGLVAACCLVELGRAPGDAVALVRAARAGTIENQRQADFVASFAARPIGARAPGG